MGRILNPRVKPLVGATRELKPRENKIILFSLSIVASLFDVILVFGVLCYQC